MGLQLLHIVYHGLTLTALKCVADDTSFFHGDLLKHFLSLCSLFVQTPVEVTQALQTGTAVKRTSSMDLPLHRMLSEPGMDPDQYVVVELQSDLDQDWLMVVVLEIIRHRSRLWVILKLQ